MYTYHEKKKDMETIKSRNIQVRLSDKDCEDLMELCGKYNITIGVLVENFLGDLIGGTFTNGSDERTYANQWFKRCWFGMFPAKTLLSHLISYRFNPEEYLECLDNIETAEEEKVWVAEHPEEAGEDDMEILDENIREWKEELEEMQSSWEIDEPDLERELSIIQNWANEKERLL